MMPRSAERNVLNGAPTQVPDVTRARSVVSTDTTRPASCEVRANRMNLLERLADDLAHEIKNPLHSMVINLEVLKRRVAKVDTDDVSDLLRYVGILDGELERVNHQLELLLRIARPGRHSGLTPLSELIDETAELLDLNLKKRKITLVREPHVDEARVQLPRSLASQLLLNLLHITLDSIVQGGTLELRTTSSSEWVQLDLYAGEPPPLEITNGGPPDQQRSGNGSANDQRLSRQVDLQETKQVAKELAAVLGGQLDFGENVASTGSSGPTALASLGFPVKPRDNRGQDR